MPDFNNIRAMAEGWCVSECGAHEDGPWQLQKLDDTDVFEDDAEAWEHVRSLAPTSPYHQSALDFLREHSPEEWDRVTTYVAPVNVVVWTGGAEA